MKEDDSCCQHGKNKDFKGESCMCTEEEMTKKEVKGKTKVAESKGQCGCSGH